MRAILDAMLLLLPAVPAVPGVPAVGGSWQCPRTPYSASRNFDVEYAVPSFSARLPLLRAPQSA